MESAVTRPLAEAMAWSRMESASRMEPSPASASRARASSSASMFSRVTRSRNWATMASNLTARKLKCWQRERMVWGISSGCVVASMKTMWSGGSSSVLSRRSEEHTSELQSLPPRRSSDLAKAEVLAARADGLGDILGLRGGQHEDDVVRRLFQRLEQGVEGGIGDLVGFVENVDFEAVASGAIAGGFAELADLVDAAVGGRIDFDDVDGIAGADLGAGVADAAGLGDGPIFGAAVQGHGEDAGDSGFEL